MEAVDNNVKKPWEQDPALWAEYTAALRDYKKSEHFIVYARLHNSPEPAASEKDFMRCLPDSLDIVALTNADNFSRYDAEDMAVMREKGTKVLWQVDYAGRAAEFADAAKLGAWLDRVVSSVAANGMDGYSFTGIPNAGDPAAVQAAALIVSKLSADESKLLVFEGNPLFVAGPCEGGLFHPRHRENRRCRRREAADTQRHGLRGRSGFETPAGGRGRSAPQGRRPRGVCRRRGDVAPRDSLRSVVRIGGLQHRQRLLQCGHELQNDPSGHPDA